MARKGQDGSNLVVYLDWDEQLSQEGLGDLIEEGIATPWVTSVILVCNPFQKFYPYPTTAGVDWVWKRDGAESENGRTWLRVSCPVRRGSDGKV